MGMKLGIKAVKAIRSPRGEANGAARTVDWLLARQHPDGHWRGPLEGDSILESEYLILLAWAGRIDGPLAERARAVAARILDLQLVDGGWAIHPGGAVDVSASVKAYLALKAVGHAADTEPLLRARKAIARAGGPWAVNSFTRFYLALVGQMPYAACPAVPPEMVLLPDWFPINLGSVSAWSRTMIVPLSLMWAFKPVRRLPPDRGIAELFADARAAGREVTRLGPDGWWASCFRGIDAAIKVLERLGIAPLRRRAVAACRSWMLDRFEGSDGLGAIFPPIVWSIIGLKAMGCPDESEEVRECWRQLEGLIEPEENGTTRLEPCRSPVWDTAITLKALAEAAAADDSLDGEHLDRAVDWLLDREIRTPGDWSSRVACEPAGWCFEYANRFYPDVDDTAMVVVGLAAYRSLRATNGRADGSLRRADDAVGRACRWLESMQNSDGGWAAFDRDNTLELLCKVPFADHNAMIDPSSPDLTGRVLEAFGRVGYRVGHATVDRGCDYLRARQEHDGSWFGRWGVNYIYGTWQAIEGLTAVGVAEDDPAVTAAADWLVDHQQPGGGWGESPESYADRAWAGRGEPTPSQTAWALAGLVAAGRDDSEAVEHGTAWLLARQHGDGSWEESAFTGTGFPKVFYLRYHYYRIYFPLIALIRAGRSSAASALPVRKREVHEELVA
jgi:squalene-hopene/tetraprenyl-beta-curcumene cyclase